MDNLKQPARKLPKAARREQLLETAHRLIGEIGTEGLTLGNLAERAGVSKPIAYEHFGTRAGLFIALCGAYDVRQRQAQREALGKGGDTLEGVVRIFAAAYVDCVLTMGPEYGAAFAALEGSDETTEFRQSLRDGYVAAYREGFGRVVDLPEVIATPIYTGFLGAAEAMAKDAASGRLTREQAVDGLAAIFAATLSAYRKK